MSSLLIWVAFQLMMVGDASKSQTLLYFAYQRSAYSDEYIYISMINQWNLGNVETSKQLAEKLLESFSAADRYKGVAFAIKNEIALRADEKGTQSEFTALRDEMRAVKHKLRNSYKGKDTQARQKKIVSILDRMIKEREDAKASKGKSGEAQEEMRKPGGNGGNKPSAPQADSQVDNTGGPGKIDPKKARELAKQWGRLPPREREVNMRGLTQNLPARYKELISEYFRKLSEESHK
jgi:hypothetical protein